MLEAALRAAAGEVVDLPITIGGVERSGAGEAFEVVRPDRHSHVLGRGNGASHQDATDALEATRRAAGPWRRLPFDDRAAILLRAADLLS